MKAIQRLSLLVVIAAAGIMLAGCGQTYYEERAVLVGVPMQMTTDDVVAAAKAGESADVIISKLQNAGFAGSLTTNDVDTLRAEGVPEDVINWMLAHPGAQPLESAPILYTAQGVPVERVVYVDRTPDVVVVERAPRVTYSFGFGYTWGRHYHYPRYYGHYRYYRYPRTRVYRGGGGRVYRYTSGH